MKNSPLKFAAFGLMTIVGLAQLSLTGAAAQTVVPQPPMPEKAAARPKPDFSVVVKGGKLFQQNCARCHGPLGQGRPRWNQADANGKYPPPPLNGTGHTWHHPTRVLKQIIKDGTAKLGGNMPAWKGKLSDDDIDAILEWIKAQWPDNIYEAWSERDKQD
jgi:mono/diheme cytochrome c family protein